MDFFFFWGGGVGGLRYDSNTCGHKKHVNSLRNGEKASGFFSENEFF